MGWRTIPFANGTNRNGTNIPNLQTERIETNETNERHQHVRFSDPFYVRSLSLAKHGDIYEQKQPCMQISSRHSSCARIPLAPKWSRTRNSWHCCRRHVSANEWNRTRRWVVDRKLLEPMVLWTWVKVPRRRKSLPRRALSLRRLPPMLSSSVRSGSRA